MAKDRLLFLLSFALIGVVAALLFGRKEAPVTPAPAVQEEKVEGGKEKVSSKEKISQREVVYKREGALQPEAGKVAVPILLTTRSSIVQFLTIGSFVDVIFTSHGDTGFGTITLPLLDNLRVLDMGRNSEGDLFSEGGILKPNTPIEVLVELTPKQADILSYAEQAGVISIGIEGGTPTKQDNELVEKLLASQSPTTFQSILATYMINSLFPDKSDVKIIATTKGYIVSGKVKDQQVNEKIDQILRMLAADKDKGVVNLIEVSVEAPQALAALKDIDDHATLNENDYEWVPVESGEVTPTLILRNDESEKWVKEYITSRKIPRGKFITRSDIAWEKELPKTEEKASEALPLMPCHVAVPYDLNSESPIFPFMRPGLRVDLRFISSPDVGLSPVNLSLFKNVRVLSMGAPGKGRGKEDEIPPRKLKQTLRGKPSLQPSSPPMFGLSLEMTPRQAEIFSFAQRAGLVTLELTECNPCDDSREIMGMNRSNDYGELVDLLLESESYEDFRSILVTFMIRSIFPQVCVEVTLTPRGVIVEGKVPDPQMADKILEILSKLIPGAEQAIINLLDVKPQQVLLKVRVYEVRKGVTSRIGVNWSVLFDNNKQALGLSSVFPLVDAPNYFFNGKGTFGNYQLSVLLDMLEEDNSAKILAAPNITTVSGQTAHFFSGGEFPILIPQGTGLLGLTTVTVVYKKYGVLLDFTPEVDLNGLITLHVVPEVSNLDKENAVSLSGFLIPALLTRRADTKVKLWPGQSYIIGGLYLDEQINRNDNLYGLNKVPVIGALFNSNRYEQKKQELLFIVTPYLIDNDEIKNYDTPSTGRPPCEAFSNPVQSGEGGGCSDCQSPCFEAVDGSFDLSCHTPFYNPVYESCSYEGS